MITLNDLPDKWKETMFDMYSEGAADVEIRAKFGLSYRAWNNLKLDFDEFREAVLMGQQMSEAFWHRVGRTNLYNKEFQQGLWYRNMQNRFGWRDKADTTTSDDSDDIESVEDVHEEIRRVVSIDGGKSK